MPILFDILAQVEGAPIIVQSNGGNHDIWQAAIGSAIGGAILLMIKAGEKLIDLHIKNKAAERKAAETGLSKPLRELRELFDDGHLTQQEYDQQKQVLLGRPAMPASKVSEPENTPENA